MRLSSAFSNISGSATTRNRYDIAAAAI
jgi:hypothetical protein